MTYSWNISHFMFTGGQPSGAEHKRRPRDLISYHSTGSTAITRRLHRVRLVTLTAGANIYL